MRPEPQGPRCIEEIGAVVKYSGSDLFVGASDNF